MLTFIRPGDIVHAAHPIQLPDERFDDFKKDLRAALTQVVDTYEAGAPRNGVFRNTVLCSTPE